MKDFIGEAMNVISSEGNLSLELIVSNEPVEKIEVPHFYARISNDNDKHTEVLLHINTEYPFIHREAAIDIARNSESIRHLQRHASEILELHSYYFNDPYWSDILNYFVCVEQKIKNIHPRDAMEIFSKLLLLCEVFKDRIIHVGNNPFYEEKHERLMHFFSEVAYVYIPWNSKERCLGTTELMKRFIPH